MEDSIEKQKGKDKMKKLYTPEEVAEILTLSPNTIRAWLRNGHIKGIKVSGKAWRIKQSELERLLEYNSQEGEGE